MGKLTISLPDEVLDELKVAAESYGLSKSAFVSMCVRDRNKQDRAFKVMPQIGKFFQLCDEHKEELFRGRTPKEFSAGLDEIKEEIGATK